MLNIKEYNNIKIGTKCKVGHFGGVRGSFFGEPATVVKIQKDEYGGARICVKGDKSGYSVYCNERGYVKTKRFGNNIVVIFAEMVATDLPNMLYDFNK